MKKTIGKILSFEEVKKLEDGTKVYIEASFPIYHVFLGTKMGNYFVDDSGVVRWVISEDFRVLCKVYEWRSNKGINQLERLMGNIRIFESQGMTDDTFKTFIEDNINLDSIDELNDLMETEMSYWEG